MSDWIYFAGHVKFPTNVKPSMDARTFLKQLRETDGLIVDDLFMGESSHTYPVATRILTEGTFPEGIDFRVDNPDVKILGSVLEEE